MEQSNRSAALTNVQALHDQSVLASSASSDSLAADDLEARRRFAGLADLARVLFRAPPLLFLRLRLALMLAAAGGAEEEEEEEEEEDEEEEEEEEEASGSPCAPLSASGLLLSVDLSPLA